MMSKMKLLLDNLSVDIIQKCQISKYYNTFFHGNVMEKNKINIMFELMELFVIFN